MATESVSALPHYKIKQNFRDQTEPHGDQPTERPTPERPSPERPTPERPSAEKHAPSRLTLPMSGERPTSALAREVRITDYAGPVNPDPLGLDETDTLIEEYLSPRKLKALTGIDELEHIHFLEMKVDSTETSLGNFGSLLPSLSQLKLNNSIVASIRDLGSSFSCLKILWMARCCLQDVDGISAMSNVRELYLSYNEVSDISPLSMLDLVEVIDLEGNNIDDVAQVEYLALCGKLRTLTLEGNPICITPHPNATSMDYDYRQVVKKALPSVQVLDDEPLVVTRGGSRAPSGFESDWNFLMELEKDGTIGSVDSLESSEDIPIAVAGVRPTTGYRPGSALRPSSATKRIGTANRRPATSGLRPSSAGRPGSTSRPESSGSGDYDVQENSSPLTQGGVVCGNVARALKSRQRRVPAMVERPKLFAELRHKPESSYTVLEEEDPEDQLGESADLLEEIKQFKLEHAKVKERIESSRAPQVLTIDHLSPSSSADESEDTLGEDDEEEEEEAQEEGRGDGPQDPSQKALPVSSVRARQYNRQRQREGKVNLSESRLSSKRPSAGQPLVDEDRPSTGPASVGNPRKFSLEPAVDKHSPKVIDKEQPVIRAELKTPEKPKLSRFSKTANAAVHLPKPPRMRGGPSISGLPSKPSVPKFS